MGRKNHKSGSKGNFKRDLRKEILNVFNILPKKPLNHKQVASTLGIDSPEMRKVVYEVLKELETSGTLKEIEHGKFLLTEQESSNLEGIIQITRQGRGFVMIDGRDKDIEIPKDKTGTAFWGDRVEVSLNPFARRPEGRVIKVLERARDRYVGVLEISANHAFLLPTDSKIHLDFYIPLSELNDAVNGEKVVVELLEWKDGKDNPTGKVVRVLGEPGKHDVEMHAILEEYSLPYIFPKEVLDEADQINRSISASEIKRRRDFRETLTFTIDPEDAKDFDDALSFKKLSNANVEIGIHIADVAHYMLPGTLLEKEAFERATSVYLVDRVVPMLPEVLSNELCSLRPNEDKLCFSAVFEMDSDANIMSEWFGRTIIHSDRRFSYEEAQAVIETGNGDHSEAILELDRLAKVLRNKRMALGGIDFDTEEVKFKLDEEGTPIFVYTKVMRDSNRLIEDFMLLANRKVAEFVGKTGEKKPKTFVYRIHDKPSDTKLAQLKLFVSRFGYELPKGSNEALPLLRTLLDLSKDKPEEDIIKQMCIRSMAKAEYSTQNIGHFGLSFEYYSHFTSPIRRYPDVMVHRLLAEYLEGAESASEKEYEYNCKHSSMREKRATEAERASIKYKQVQFLMNKIGEEFDGIISGLTNWGMYVELSESKCEGMVSSSNMLDDYYNFDEDRYVMRGSRKGKEYTMGQAVKIKVAAANLQKRQLDFELVTEDEEERPASNRPFKTKSNQKHSKGKPGRKH